MKKMISAVLLLTSLSSFASALNESVVEAVKTQAAGPITGEQAKNVKKAVAAELQARTLSCTIVVDSGSAPTNQAIKTQMISIINDAATTVSVEENGSQPAITMTRVWSETEDTIAQFTTSADFKSITSFYVSKDKLTKVERNVGTILNPRFETVTERKSSIQAGCTLMP